MNEDDKSLEEKEIKNSSDTNDVKDTDEESLERSKPTVPLAKYTTEKAKRKEYEEELSNTQKILEERERELEELREAREAKAEATKQGVAVDRDTLETIKYLAERERQRQTQELFEKDYQALIKRYPEANKPEVKQHLYEVGNKYTETPFDVLYKASDYYHKNTTTVEDGTKSVDEGSSKAKINIQNPSIDDYKKILDASDEEYNKYIQERFGQK